MGRLVVIAVAVVLVAIGATWWAVRDVGPRRAATPTPTPTTEPTPAPTPAGEPAARSRPSRPGCNNREGRPIDPVSISVPGVVRRAGIVTPPRTVTDVPGTPPLTEAGKGVFGLDLAQGIRPGDRRGNVLLNAHTWPDGSALGNRLLTRLDRGDLIVVHGREVRLCYRVSEEVEVLASEGLPRYYERAGKHRLAIVVCSGRRLGPGEWEKRTVWFATPQA